MPGLDRTGPEGQGSGTGRLLGDCNPRNRRTGQQQPYEEYSTGHKRGRGLKNRRGPFDGQGRGRGRGPGSRRRFDR